MPKRFSYFRHDMVLLAVLTLAVWLLAAWPQRQPSAATSPSARNDKPSRVPTLCIIFHSNLRG